MKKSNKILLGGILTVILIITGIHIALFAKYQTGDYTIYQPEDILPSMDQYPGVSFVTLHNVNGEVQFGDIASVQKNRENSIECKQVGDTLVITGREGRQLYGKGSFNFTLPPNVTLKAFNSSIYFKTGKENSATNPVIHLHKSVFIFNEYRQPIRLSLVKLYASDSSLASFNDHTQIDQLEVQLNNSRLEYHDGDPGQLSIMTDSLSRLSLLSKHLLKAKITTIPN